MRKRTTLVSASILVLGWLCPAATLRAEELLGARARLTVPSLAEARIVGKVLAEDDQSLTLAVTGETRRIERAAIGVLEISRERSRKGRGAAIGAVTGLVLGAALGYAAGEVCTGGEIVCFTRGDMAVGSGVGFALIGTTIGALASRGERWEPVEARRFRVSAGPARGRGVAAGVTLSF